LHLKNTDYIKRNLLILLFLLVLFPVGAMSTRQGLAIQRKLLIFARPQKETPGIAAALGRDNRKK
jgi:hypothetical protein